MAVGGEWLRHLSDRLYALQQEQTLCDVTLEGKDGAEVRLHSLLLVAASSRFSCIPPPFILKCADCSGEALELLVHYLYTGSTDVGRVGGAKAPGGAEAEPVGGEGREGGVAAVREMLGAAEALGIQYIVDHVKLPDSPALPDVEDHNGHESMEDDVADDVTDDVADDVNDQAADDEDARVIDAAAQVAHDVADHVADDGGDHVADDVGDHVADDVNDEVGLEQSTQGHDEANIHVEVKLEDVSANETSLSPELPSNTGADCVTSYRPVDDATESRDTISRGNSHAADDIAECETKLECIDDNKMGDQQIDLEDSDPDVLDMNREDPDIEMADQRKSSPSSGQTRICKSQNVVGHPDENSSEASDVGTNDAASRRHFAGAVPPYLLKMAVRATYIERGEVEAEGEEGGGGGVQYVCRFCKLVFEDGEREAFIEHKKSHGEMKPYQCPVCLRRFLLKNVMLRHRKSHAAIGCDQPGRQPSRHPTKQTTSHPTKQEVNHGEGLPRRDDYSDDVTEQPSEKGHVLRETNPVCESREERPRKGDPEASGDLDPSNYVLKSECHSRGEFRCSLCGMVKKGYENFLAHKLKHAGVVPFHCKYCNKGWYRKSDCKRHEAKATCGKNRIGNMNFGSNNAYGKRSAVFVKHDEVRRKGKKKWYKCSICGKAVATYVTFLAHKFMHAGVRPFRCALCRSAFNRLHELKRHRAQSLCDDVHLKIRALADDEEDNEQPGGGIWRESQELTDINTLLKQVEEFECKLERGQTDSTTLESKPDVGYSNTDIESHVTNGESQEHEFHSENSVNCDKDKSGIENVTLISRAVDTSQLGTGSKNDIKSPTLLDDYAIEQLKLALHVLQTAPKEELMNNLKQAKSKSGDFFNDSSSGSDSEQPDNDEPPKTNRSRRFLASKYILDGEKLDSEMVRFRCSICGKEYKNTQGFIGHKMSHNAEKPFRCQKCGRGFVRNVDFKLHMKQHKFDLLHPCGTCGEQFSSKSKLVTHYLCRDNACRMPPDLQWQDEEGRRKNVATHRYQCALCGKAYPSKQELGIHSVHAHDGRGMRTYSCEVCRAVLTTKVGFVLHMKRHGNCKEFSCPECDKAFLRNCDLQAHRVKHRDVSDMECPRCGKTFKHRNSLRMHLMLHAGHKPYLCKICGKDFTQKGNLRKHESETHAQSRNYGCKLCERQFFTEGGLRTHVKTRHTSQRPYTCERCGKGFVSRVVLARHASTHDAHRPFECPVCRKLFRMLQAARRHCMNVHGFSKECVQTTNFARADDVTRGNVTPAPTPAPDVLQGAQLVQIGNEHFRVELPPNSSVPTLQMLGSAPVAAASDVSGADVIKAEAPEEPVLMLVGSGGDLAMQLQAAGDIGGSFVLDDDGALTALPEVHAEEVIAGGQGVPVSGDERVCYYIKYP